MPVPCVAEFSVCFPGEYELQLWHWERDATRNETSLPDKADVWRQDARLKQLLLSHRMSVVVTNEKAVSPDAFPECLKEEKDGFRMGHWVDINCTDAPSAALVIRDPAVLHEVCKDRSVLYTNPRGLTWKKFPDWLTFFAYLQPRPDSHIYTKTVWVPPITNQAPPLNVKQMARGLGRTWVHISGDSVGFEEFAAIFRLALFLHCRICIWSRHL